MQTRMRMLPQLLIFSLLFAGAGGAADAPPNQSFIGTWQIGRTSYREHADLMDEATAYMTGLLREVYEFRPDGHLAIYTSCTAEEPADGRPARAPILMDWKVESGGTLVVSATIQGKRMDGRFQVSTEGTTLRLMEEANQARLALGKFDGELPIRCDALEPRTARTAARRQSALQLRQVVQAESPMTQRMAVSKELAEERPNAAELIVSKEVLLDESMLQDVSVTVTPLSTSPAVKIQFTGAAEEILVQATRRLLGKRLAVIVDDEIVFVAQVQFILGGGTMIIPASDPLAAATLATKIAGAVPPAVQR